MNLEEIYRDQAFEQTHVYDRVISSFYTPEGIRRIDKRFCHRIMAFKRGEKFIEYSYNYSFKPPRKEVEYEWDDTYDSLKKDIEENPHLHSIIKENLLHNLNL
jgi:hypothetical protein